MSVANVQEIERTGLFTLCNHFLGNCFEHCLDLVCFFLFCLNQFTKYCINHKFPGPSAAYIMLTNAGFFVCCDLLHGVYRF